MLCQTTAYIDLKNIEHNTKVVRSRLNPQTKIMAAVKAEAYGHGIAAVSAKLYSLGVTSFAVACLDEALSLRQCLPDCEILILGFTHPSQAAILSENRISQAIYSEEFALALSGYCKKNGVCVTAHLAFDTGMGRIGFTDAEPAIRSSRLEGIQIVGAFTHFSRADMTDSESIEYTKNQYKIFENIVIELKKEIKTSLVCHCANSAGIFKYPEFQMDMVRAGIVLYGLAPNPDDEQSYMDIKPAMQLKTVISHIKTIEAGTAISYGGTFVADKQMRIATVPCGYADGYLRSFGAGYALVCGQKAKIVGRVCMDQMMLDVTDIPQAQLLCEVTLMGKSGQEYISADDLARLDESINYQVVCGVTKRVIRVYE